MTQATHPGTGAAKALADVRHHLRFPLVTDLDYRIVIGGRPIKMGRGRTVNLSSGGVLFQSTEPLPARKQIELWIAWPVPLNGDVALKLCAQGRIVRVQDGRVAVEFARCEFRTGRLGTQTKSSPC